MHKDFNFQHSCSALIQFLDKKNGFKNTLRISLDVQLPENVNGDEHGLLDTITRICTFLSMTLINGIIDIEIVKIGQLNQSVIARVDIRGTSSVFKKESEYDNEIRLALKGWMATLPYKTSIKIISGQYVFSFQICLALTEVPLPDDAKPFQSKKVLLVEDNAIPSLIVFAFLEKWGCEVTKIGSHYVIATLCKTGYFDIVLINMDMSVLKTDRIIKEVRLLKSSIPIIAMSASSQEQDVMDYFSVGANDFLLKPISIQRLKNVLTKYL